MSEPIKDTYKGVKYEVTRTGDLYPYTVTFDTFTFTGATSHPLDSVIAAKRKIDTELRTMVPSGTEEL